MSRPKRLKDRPRNIAKEIVYSEDELKQVTFAAKQVGLRLATYIRKVSLAERIRPAKSLHAQELVESLGNLGADLSRIGNNLNQLTHQANMDNFPREDVLLQSKSELDALIARIVEVIKDV